MNTSFLALRAITAVTFRRLLTWVSIAAAIILVALWAGMLALVIFVNPWWWLMTVILLPVTLGLTLFATLLFALTKRLVPRKLTGEESAKVHHFTSTLLGLAEVRATPLPILAFLIGKDILRGRQSSFIESTISDAKGLRGQFDAIRNMFK